MIDASALSRAINLIHQINGVLPINIKEQDSLVKDLAMDSVELIDLFLRLEQAGVTVEESKISSGLTVGDIARFINSAVNN
ncbi:acyl carrier protein [Erwinia piriflorinigrans]|uniref:Acyl carrier protein (ACP) n=1 Tax=Erwinia piriflorinigrans CFBP 5888 TaxID=1161919 RepID=V5Z7S1_9GAMM|nr:acyl carrier protein [Erwinia piriflorinigrans]CCG87080.1 Acyl carrier protein (ACP) [Erwinia piriflorinigrans CFBP 5888]